MLHRSSSSHRRRTASRGGAGVASTSSSQNRGTRSAATSPRRASIAIVSPMEEPKNILLMEINKSPRHSIIPDISLEEDDMCRHHDDEQDIICYSNSRSRGHQGGYGRSPRNSLVPAETAVSPRNSLVPETALSPRNSLVPEPAMYTRSPRNSLTPETGTPSRTPRHSITSETAIHHHISTSRLNIITNQDFPRGGGGGVVTSRSTSPRHSISSATNLRTAASPRGSITGAELTPRGSISGAELSPRGSIGQEIGSRGSPVSRSNLDEEPGGGWCRKSPRGSLTLTFQEPEAVGERRPSAEGRGGNRCMSPYRPGSRGGNSGHSDNGSRRASSSVSQVSGDEQRRLCSSQNFTASKKKMRKSEEGIILSLTTYGSVAYQLKDANLEATGTCDFVWKALGIVNKTVVVTIVLVCLSVLPMVMLIMGVQFVRDCPTEPNIPIYMIVGGSVGCIKMIFLLYSQLHTRRMDSVNTIDSTSITSKLVSVALTIFLIIWFSLGNYWIIKTTWPDFAPTLFEPNKWCHKTLFIFSLLHLFIIYSVFGVFVILIITLACCQLFGCSWLGPTRYK